MMSEAKIKAKSFLRQYGISKITLENLLYIIEQQGFEILEYSQLERTDSVWEIIENLKLTPHAQSGKAFAYQCGRTKLIFLCEELSADEKLYALAHEEGHILCGHLTNGVCDSNLVEQEHIANEIAHYILNPPFFHKLLLVASTNRRITIPILIVCLCIAITILVIANVIKNQSYYGEYYITENGTKYHEDDCMIIKDKNNKKRLTESDYYSGEYEPCQVCLPN